MEIPGLGDGRRISYWTHLEAPESAIHDADVATPNPRAGSCSGRGLGYPTLLDREVVGVVERGPYETYPSDRGGIDLDGLSPWR